jgi:hypothetical protein
MRRASVQVPGRVSMVKVPRDPFKDADSFSQHLADQIPPLSSVLNEHLEDNCGELLPHVFMDDVARWFLQAGHSSNGSESVTYLIELLDRALVAGSSDVRELVQASFVENLPTSLPSDPIFSLLSPALKADFARYSGIDLSAS